MFGFLTGLFVGVAAVGVITGNRGILFIAAEGIIDKVLIATVGTQEGLIGRIHGCSGDIAGRADKNAIDIGFRAGSPQVAALTETVHGLPCRQR